MRIANVDLKNRLLDTVSKNAAAMQDVQKQLATGQRVDRPSVDPGAAINSVYQRTQLRQTEQFQKNTQQARDLINVGHDTLGQLVQSLQRTRELAVTGANGTFTPEDRVAMAAEVDEMLKATVQAANTRQEDRFFFSGDEWKTAPFREQMGDSRGLGRPMIESVEYRGNDREQTIEIGRGDAVPVAVSGNRAFWGTKHMVVSLKDASNWVSETDQSLRIDGKEVQVGAGENLETLIDRINGEVPSVKAFRRELPTGEVVLGLESADPHRMQLEDVKGGTVFADLGLLRSGKEATQVGNNIHPNVMESGGSVFDVMIRFRNALLANDAEGIGSRDIAAISSSLDSALQNQARLSAASARLEQADKRLAREGELTTERLSKNEDVDMADAAVRYGQLELLHRVSLQTAGKLLQPTLMDFVR